MTRSTASFDTPFWYQRNAHIFFLYPCKTLGLKHVSLRRCDKKVVASAPRPNTLAFTRFLQNDLLWPLHDIWPLSMYNLYKAWVSGSSDSVSRSYHVIWRRSIYIIFTKWPLITPTWPLITFCVQLICSMGQWFLWPRLVVIAFNLEQE